MKRIHMVIAISLSSLVLSGCVSGGGGTKREFACERGQGVNCMSAQDVYAATESRDHLEGLTDASGELVGGTPQRASRGARSATEVVESEGALMLTSISGGADPYVVPDAPEDVPIRTPAKVMRIWIAPWEDDQGDLHMTGKVFTEIAPRRWAVGDPQSTHRTKTMQLIAPPKATLSAPTTASGDAGTAGKTSAGS